MKWAKRNSFGEQWRRKKARTVVDQEDESDSYTNIDIEDDDAGVIHLPGDKEFDSVDNVGNNEKGDDDDEGNDNGSRGGESDDDSDVSRIIKEMTKGGVNG